MKTLLSILFIIITVQNVRGKDLTQLISQYKKEPANYLLCNKIGLEYIKRNDISNAKNYFLKSVILNNNFYTGYYNLGVIYYKQQNYISALINFKRAYSLNKRDEKVTLALINTLIHMKKYSRIRDIIPEIMKNFQNTPSIINSIAIYYILTEKYETAYKYLKQILESNNDYKILNNIALTKYFLKDKNKAIEYLKSVKKDYKVINNNLKVIGGKNK